MSTSPYDLVATPAGVVARIRARGSAVLGNPSINQGTAFSHSDRRALGLTGLLPRAVKTIEAQRRRA